MPNNNNSSENTRETYPTNTTIARKFLLMGGAAASVGIYLYYQYFQEQKNEEHTSGDANLTAGLRYGLTLAKDVLIPSLGSLVTALGMAYHVNRQNARSISFASTSLYLAGEIFSNIPITAANSNTDAAQKNRQKQRDAKKIKLAEQNVKDAKTKYAQITNFLNHSEDDLANLGRSISDNARNNNDNTAGIVHYVEIELAKLGIPYGSNRGMFNDACQGKIGKHLPERIHYALSNYQQYLAPDVKGQAEKEMNDAFVKLELSKQQEPESADDLINAAFIKKLSDVKVNYEKALLEIEKADTFCAMPTEQLRAIVNQYWTKERNKDIPKDQIGNEVKSIDTWLYNKFQIPRLSYTSLIFDAFTRSSSRHRHVCEKITAALLDWQSNKQMAIQANANLQRAADNLNNCKNEFFAPNSLPSSFNANYIEPGSLAIVELVTDSENAHGKNYFAQSRYIVDKLCILYGEVNRQELSNLFIDAYGKMYPIDERKKPYTEHGLLIHVTDYAVNGKTTVDAEKPKFSFGQKVVNSAKSIANVGSKKGLTLVQFKMDFTQVSVSMMNVPVFTHTFVKDEKNIFDNPQPPQPLTIPESVETKIPDANLDIAPAKSEKTQATAAPVLASFNPDQEPAKPEKGFDSVYTKDTLQARDFLRRNENLGEARLPILKVYLDHKKIPTVATGFNLDRIDAPQKIEGMGINYKELRAGKISLTMEQALRIERFVFAESEEVLIRKLGKETYSKLEPHQQTALISMAVCPNVIGEKLIGAIKESRWKDAEYEIRRRSNKEKHEGLQLRREREANLFMNIQPKLQQQHQTPKRK